MDTFELYNSNLNKSTVVIFFESYSFEFNNGTISAPLNKIENGRFISEINISCLFINGLRCLNGITFL